MLLLVGLLITTKNPVQQLHVFTRSLRSVYLVFKVHSVKTYMLLQCVPFLSSESGKYKSGQSGKGVNEVTGEQDPGKAYGGRGKDSVVTTGCTVAV